MIRFGLIEEFLVSLVPIVVVLGQIDIEVGNPAHFTVEVPIFDHTGIIRHPCALNFILQVGIQLLIRLQ